MFAKTFASLLGAILLADQTIALNSRSQRSSGAAARGLAARTTAWGPAVDLFGSKRGIAYNDANLANTLATDCPNCKWAYNWDQTDPGLNGPLNPPLNYVPMLWGPTHTQYWDASAQAAIAAGSKVFFSFNEPDMPSQAATDPTTAANLHIQYMNPYAGQVRIGAPSVSNSGSAGQGLDWLQQWINVCNAQAEPCHFDFCNIHWYSGIEYTDTLFTQLDSAFSICEGKPIWLTEFAPTSGSDQDIANFMDQVIPQLDALNYLEAYSYQWTAVGSLFSDQTTLSAYGQQYASIPI